MPDGIRSVEIKSHSGFDDGVVRVTRWSIRFKAATDSVAGPDSATGARLNNLFTTSRFAPGRTYNRYSRSIRFRDTGLAHWADVEEVWETSVTSVPVAPADSDPLPFPKPSEKANIQTEKGRSIEF